MPLRSRPFMQVEAGAVRQECAVGVVALREMDGAARWAFAAPALRRSTPDAIRLAAVCAALGLQTRQVKAAQVLNNGPEWLGLLLDRPDTVLALSPDHSALKALGEKVGVAEVPVTGSLNASLAQWLMADGQLPHRYQATQGQALGRDGQVFLSRDAQGQVWVGGDVVCCINGEVVL